MREYQCDVCNWGFLRKETVTGHLASLTRKSKGKSVTFLLNIHMYTHIVMDVCNCSKPTWRV